MQTYMILSAIGPDRPGLVDEVTDFIYRHGGNVEDSRMAGMGGQFGIILLLSGDRAKVNTVESDREQLQRETGLTVITHWAEAPGAEPKARAVPYQLKLFSLDHPGLLHRVAHLLRQFEINIDSLESHAAPAPTTGTMLFTMHMTITIPEKVKIHDLHEQINRLADEINVQISLEPGIVS